MADLAGFAGSSEQRYAIDRKIASGGMASVYLARGVGPLGFERPVAIKACHPHLLDGDDRRNAFLDEARVAARIHHPNVVATLDVVVHDGTVVIVMEYVEGLTVAGLLKQAPLPVQVALRVIGDALAGLHAAHELRDEQGILLGVVHRDVSPQNILVGIDGFAKLADFGVFKGSERMAPSTASGDLKGKLGYVAPEVYRGEPVTRRADVFAMGVVLWESLAGKRLFGQTTHAAVMHDSLRGNVPSLPALRDDVPAEIDGVIARALAVDPEERFATAEDFANALEALPVGVATTRVVGQLVRTAVAASVPPPPARLSGPREDAGRGSRRTDDVAYLSIDGRAGVREMHELLTPSEYVTPVRAERPGTRSTWKKSGPMVIGLVGLAIVAAVSASFVVRARRTAAASEVAATATATATAPAAATATAAATAIGAATATAAATDNVPKATPSTLPRAKSKPKAAPAGSARPPSGHSPFDPEEI